MLLVDFFGLDELSIACKYSTSYIDRLHEVPGAHFDSDTKNWIIPYNSLAIFEKLFKGEIVWRTPEWQIKSLPIPDAKTMYTLDNNIVVPTFKIKPYDYQEFGIKFMIDRVKSVGFSFNTDGVGLGKTLQALGVMMYGHQHMKMDRFVILCKKSIKFQWKQEILKFTDLDQDLLIEYMPESVTPKKRQKIYDKCKAHGKFVLITTYQSSLTDKVLLDDLKADMVIIDEAHILRNRTGKINAAVRFYTDKIPYKIFLTGTPLMTKPVDIYGLMLIADEKYLGPWKQFEQKHIRYEWRKNFLDEVGYMNLDELRDKIQHVLIRRTENEVSLQLPQIMHKQIDVPMDDIQKELTKILKVNKESKLDEIAKIEKILENPENLSPEQTIKLLLLQGRAESALKGLIASDQAIADDPRLFFRTTSKMVTDLFASHVPITYKGSPKTEAILDQLEEIFDQGQKAVVFSKYVRYVEVLAEDIAKKLNVKVLIYHGQLHGDLRNQAIQKFTNDPNGEYPVIVMTDAGSEGLNLQVACHQFNCDLPDSPAIKTQRMGRIRRASSTFIKGHTYDFITEDSFDVEKLKTLERAQNVFNGLVEIDEAQSIALKELMNP